VKANHKTPAIKQVPQPLPQATPVLKATPTVQAQPHLLSQATPELPATPVAVVAPQLLCLMWITQQKPSLTLKLTLTTPTGP
ncbi:hypothetical protein, partial [Lelliottia amnigena]